MSGEPLAPGTIVAGKYRIERPLGEGGMGWVLVATHMQLEQRVAIKLLRAEHAAERPDAVARFLREARAAARIQSDHVARVSDFGTLDDGSPYLVMEYLEGQDLEGLLKDGPLAVAKAVDYALQACEGLAEAHAAGIVHRDLKPANLFLARRSDGSVRVKIIDFGISKIAPAPGSSEQLGMTSTQSLMGSPLYMAPEQMRSAKSVDGRADIWSMGVILYETLAGRQPFAGETWPQVCTQILVEQPPPMRASRADVPEGLEAAILRCLAKEPSKRFADVASLVAAIAPFGSAEGRAAADRIARVARAASAPETAADASERLPVTSTPTVEVMPGATLTSNQFGTSSPATPRQAKRKTALLVATAAVGLLAGSVLVVAIVGSKGRAATPPSPAAAAAAVSVPQTATTTTTPTTAATPTAIPIHTPTATAGNRSRPAPAAPATKPKPASTSAFGGRD